MLGGDAGPSGDVPMQDLEQPTTTGRQPIDRALVRRRLLHKTGLPANTQRLYTAPSCARRCAAASSPPCTHLAPRPPANAQLRPARQVKLPLDVGTLVDAIWRDGLFHQSRIIERRKLAGGGEEEYEYYVHYRKRERAALLGSLLLGGWASRAALLGSLLLRGGTCFLGGNVQVGGGAQQGQEGVQLVGARLC